MLSVTYTVGLFNSSMFIVLTVKRLTDNEENWIAHLFTEIPMNLLYFSCQQLVFSHLLLFGCFVSSYKKKVMESIQAVFDSGKENDADCLYIFKKVLEEYVLFKDSISLSLFLIFTMLTVTSVLFINQAIHIFVVEKEISNKLLFSSWCFVLCMILVYLCLVADQTEQTRHTYIHHMW